MARNFSDSLNTSPTREALHRSAEEEKWPAGYQMQSEGLYALQDEEQALFLCPPFRILGRCAHSDGSGQGIVIGFEDGEGDLQRLVLLRADLAASPQKMLRALLDRGLMASCDSGKAQLLQQFFRQLWPKSRCQLVSRTGWVDQNHFVLPQQVIGEQKEQILYRGQSSRLRQEAGLDLCAWKEQLSVLCRGNSRLLFCLSLGFAAPLAPLLGVDAGIFHLVGPSSTGKTSVLRAAASLNTPGSLIHSWNASEAGLEAAARAHHHLLLILDEFAEIPARRAQALIYQITNGRGGLRARSDGAMRGATDWQTLVLSAGEVSLEQHCERLGTPLTDGQKVRMVNLPAPAQADCGVFENLHGAASGAVFAQQLVQAAERCSGSALAAYLEKLCQADHKTLQQQFVAAERDFLRTRFKDDCDSALWRIARRFLLTGFAGELASGYGITGWAQGEAMDAASRLLEDWLESLNQTQDLKTQEIFEQVHFFLQQNGRHFYDLDKQEVAADSGANLLGYRLQQEDATLYLVKAPVMTRQVLKGLDAKDALEELIRAGAILPCPQTGKAYSSRRLPTGRCFAQRVYYLRDPFELLAPDSASAPAGSVADLVS